MPESKKKRLAEPTRPRQKHVGESFDPVGVHKGGGGPGAGVFVMIGAGMLGFAYAFNLGGLQAIVDGLLHAFDSKARTYNGDVAAVAPKALPYIGYAVLGVVVLVVLIMLGRMAEALGNGLKPKKSAKKAAKVVKVAEGAKASQPEAPRPAQEFIRPRRLAVREEDLVPKPSTVATNPQNAD